MKNTISPGDSVILSAENGLGRGTFTVLKVYPGDLIHGLLVQGSNGEVWPARREGAKKVPVHNGRFWA
jgi:hypothetical protein